MGWAFVIIFIVCVSIVMLNLIIAIMNEAYSEANPSPDPDPKNVIDLVITLMCNYYRDMHVPHPLHLIIAIMTGGYLRCSYKGSRVGIQSRIQVGDSPGSR